MKIVIIGGTGLIGSRLVTKLRAHGHEAMAVSPDTGVDVLTGRGLADVLQGASVVVDVSNSSCLEETAAMNFFTTSTRNLLQHEAAAGVRHHVAVSIVGAERLSEGRPSEPTHTIRGYFRAKLAQEQLIERSSIPYSIVRATQVFELVDQIADAATDGMTVRLAPVLIQPMAADDIATAVGRIALGTVRHWRAPVNGIVEVAGPEQFRLDDLIRQSLRARNDPRRVVADSRVGYLGMDVDERTLLPAKDARLGEIRFQEWLNRARACGRGSRSTLGNLNLLTSEETGIHGAPPRAEHRERGAQDTELEEWPRIVRT